MEIKKRILIMVPNAASTDNRVVREAETLKRAGYDVLLAGLRLTNVGGLNAITAGGVPVRRVDWQYRAYSKIAMVYALILLPLLLCLIVAGGVLGWHLYWNFLVPITAGAIDKFSETGGFLADKYLGFGLHDSSTEQSAQFSMSKIQGFSEALYHFLIIAFLAVVVIVTSNLFRASARYFYRFPAHFLNNSAFKFLRKKVVSARGYGNLENAKRYTLLERLIAPDNDKNRGIQAKLKSHFIMESRTLGFVKLGREFLPDIVQCHEIGTLAAGIALKNEIGCKVVYEAHEIYDDLASASAQQLNTYRRIHSLHLPQVDGFITVNDDIGAYYKRTYPDLPVPVIMPNSVFPKAVTYDGRLHQAAGLPDDAKIILYQGGFSPNRGLNILLEAAFNMPDGWNVVFMGKGTLESDLKSRAEALQTLALEKLRRKISLSVLSQLDDTDKLQISNVVNVGGDGGFAQQTSLEEAVVGKLFSSDNSTTFDSDLIETTIRNVRSAEVRLAVDNKVRRKIDEVRASGSMSRVRFVPMAPHAELVEWTSGASFGVIPYENVGLNHWYCSPNKIWEYPNAGVPILASRLHFLHHIINKWEIGLTFASDPSVSEIVSVVRSVTDEDLDRLRVNCAKFISADNYTVHERRLTSLIQTL